ncbi:MAG: hypothetical protein Q7T26_02490 [Dehalococcoidia bacterium]|nr:hypothetical protein [Dehalococcoidia bacterium]
MIAKCGYCGQPVAKGRDRLPNDPRFLCGHCEAQVLRELTPLPRNAKKKLLRYGKGPFAERAMNALRAAGVRSIEPVISSGHLKPAENKQQPHTANKPKPGDKAQRKKYPVLDEGRSEDLRKDMRMHGMRVAGGGFKQGKRR